MLRKRIHLIIAVGTVLCLLAGVTVGKPVVVHRHHGRGHVFVRPHRPMLPVKPDIRRPAVTIRPHGRTFHRRPSFHRIDPKRPNHHIVVIRTHYGRIIKAFPTPRVVTRFGVVEPVIVKVWFRNSDRSLTAVELVRRGLGYVGPRGEWYHDLPTKSRLWIAYGF